MKRALEIAIQAWLTKGKLKCKKRKVFFTRKRGKQKSIKICIDLDDISQLEFKNMVGFGREKACTVESCISRIIFNSLKYWAHKIY